MSTVTMPQPVSQMQSVHGQDHSLMLGGDSRNEDELVVDDGTTASSLLDRPYSRISGDTEQNWCRAVGSGTGVTVLGIYFSRVVDAAALQRATDSVQLRHPRLRSHLLWLDGRPAFTVSDQPCVEVEVTDASSPPTDNGVWSDYSNGNSNGNGGVEIELGGERLEFGRTQRPDGENGKLSSLGAAELQDGETHEWMRHVETELNSEAWPEHQHCLVPKKMFAVRLYLLPEGRSLVVLRLHTAICDRVGAARVLTDMLVALREANVGSHCRAPGVSENDAFRPGSGDVGGHNLRSVEELIPPGKANKPFWAHGKDLLGYSLGTRRHALLPFHDPGAPRRSKLFHCVLNAEHTARLLQACEKKKVSVHAALCAAGMKAVAVMKELGRRSEHFAIISLVNCRHLLEPKLSDSTVGFYHSALMNTHHVNEHTEFWDLARRSYDSLENAIKNRKHFTDMGDLNYLMFQALQHPGLTPSSSMRTSSLVVFRDTMVADMEDLGAPLGVEHFIGCSSTHGVGPTMAIFDSIRNGALHFSGVYPNPLYSRAQMRAYVDFMVSFLAQSTPQ